MGKRKGGGKKGGKGGGRKEGGKEGGKGGGRKEGGKEEGKGGGGKEGGLCRRVVGERSEMKKRFVGR